MRKCEKYFVGYWLGRFTRHADEPNTGVRLLVFEECGIVRFPQFYCAFGKKHRVTHQDGFWRADGSNLYLRWLDDDFDEGDAHETRVIKEDDWFSWEAHVHTYRYHRISPRPVFYALPLVSHTDDTGPVPQDLIERGSPA